MNILIFFAYVIGGMVFGRFVLGPITEIAAIVVIVAQSAVLTTVLWKIAMNTTSERNFVRSCYGMLVASAIMWMQLSQALLREIGVVNPEVLGTIFGGMIAVLIPPVRNPRIGQPRRWGISRIIRGGKKPPTIR